MAPTKSAIASDVVLEDVAVNFAGKAIVDPKHNQRRFKQYISGLRPISRSMATIDKNKLLPRTTLEFTKEELNVDRYNHYLVIGYAYPDVAKAEEFSKGSTKRAVGVEKNPPQILFLGNKIPWIVVTRATQTTHSDLGYYVLTQPGQDGLCQPAQIKKELVYFFHEYRDASTGTGGRKKSWSSKVMAHCVQSSADEEPTRQESSATADDNSSSSVPVDVSEDVENNEETQPELAEDSRSLHGFIDGDSEFGEAEAHDLFKQLKVRTEVSVETVIRLREATVSTLDSIEYRIVKPWLRMCLKRLAQSGEMSDLEMKDLVAKTRDETLDWFEVFVVDKSLSHQEAEADIQRAGELEEGTTNDQRNLRDDL